jgi:hypothetical protein
LQALVFFAGGFVAAVRLLRRGRRYFEQGLAGFDGLAFADEQFGDAAGTSRW